MSYTNSILKNIVFLKSKINLFLLFSLIFIWGSIGTQMYETFNYEIYKNININFIRSNIIFLIFIILVIINFKIKKSKYLIFIIYPICGFIAHLNNNADSFYFGFHYFISISSIILLINYIVNQKDRKLSFEIINFVNITILVTYFFIIIFPDFAIKFLNKIPNGRGEHTINIKIFEYINIYMQQNSNGISRIILILLFFLMSLYNFYLKKKCIIKNFLILATIIILAHINIFYMSKLNIIFFFVSAFFILVLFEKKSLKNYISLLLIIIIPILTNYYYQKEVIQNNEWIINNRIINNLEGLFLFKNIKTFSKKNEKKLDIELVKNDLYNFKNEKDFCDYHDHPLNKFSSGRYCGWLMLINLSIKEKNFFGKGFFSDQKILRKFQKISSNSYVFALYNAGVLGFFSILFFYTLFFFKIIKIYKNKKIFSSSLAKFYLILSKYLLTRSIFEDTLAFLSIDLLLLVGCISFFNYYLLNSSNLESKILK